MSRGKAKCFVLFAFIAMCLAFSACKIWKQFEDWVKTSDDGFIYYYITTMVVKMVYLDILDVEELTIPEYIDGKKLWNLVI